MLVILEMANNHGGDVQLGKRIIDEHYEVTKQFPQFRFAFKYQYRDLDTFIHPSSDPNHKYVKRFRETNLPEHQRFFLKDYAKTLGFLTACTPFDEKSVDMVVNHGYDILKIGSPSFTDYALWDKVFMWWRGPIIASCGGATEDDIDTIVQECNGIDLTLMHCVSEYPTKPENLQLNQIDWLKKRYPNVKVGLSSHQKYPEMPGELFFANGNIDAYELHVCVDPKPNGYSISNNELPRILRLFSNIEVACGDRNTRIPGPKPVQFMRRMIDGKMWWKPEEPPLTPTGEIVRYIKDIIKKSNVVIPKGSKAFLSHHYGIKKFRHFGACIIECFNMDEYAKKIIVMLPGQYHEEHKHLLKHETFHVLYGDLFITSGGQGAAMMKGDTWAVPPGTPHKFTTDKGCVFEEISTHQHENDSVYDVELSKDRKTQVEL